MIRAISPIPNYNNRVTFQEAEKTKKSFKQIVADGATPRGKTIDEMKFHYNMFILFQSLLLLGLTGLLLTSKKGNLFKKDASISKAGQSFKSLADDVNIPKLENCKSLNKNLKQILERQVNIAKAGKNIPSEFADDTLVSNRFLLFGPPGSGKSYFAKVYAKSLDAKYMDVLFSDVNSKWAGETESKMSKMFDYIKNTATTEPDKKFVVAFNEIDSFVVPPDNLTSSSGSHWVTILRERSVFLNSIEELKEKAPNVTIIGTTNISPQNNKLDRAAMSRFQSLIEVDYPDSDCLYEALKQNLPKLKNKDSFFQENEENLKQLAKSMSEKKFSFRNLEYIIKDAKEMYLNDKIKDNTASFKMKYLDDSMNSMKLSDGDLEKKVSVK